MFHSFLGLLSFDHWPLWLHSMRASRHPYHWFCCANCTSGWYIFSILLFYKVVVYRCTHQNSHSLGGGVYLVGDEFRAGFFYFRSNIHRATHCRSLCALPVRGHPLSIRLFNLIVDVSPKTFQEYHRDIVLPRPPKTILPERKNHLSMKTRVILMITILITRPTPRQRSMTQWKVLSWQLQ